MTTKSTAILNAKFDIEPISKILPDIVSTAKQSTAIITTETIDTTLADQDFLKARETLIELIETGKKTLDDLLRVAKETEHPRPYEVASQMIKTLADASKDLMSVHKSRHDTLPASAEKGSKIERQTNMFFGSTQDMLRAIQFAENNPNADEIIVPERVIN